MKEVESVFEEMCCEFVVLVVECVCDSFALSFANAFLVLFFR